MAIKPIVKEIEEDVVFSIYPPKVIYVNGKKAIINYGDKLLKVGERFDVYRFGKKLFDPYTHEPLGYEEIKIGTVEITRTNPKYSVAKIVDGTATVGSILKKIRKSKSSSKKEKVYRKSNIKVQDSGTVKLPWD